MRPSNDTYYCMMLKLVAARSTCVRRAVGAIITDERNRVMSMGFNGVPSGFPHCIDEPCAGANDPPGDSSRCFATHAELNAMMQCADLWRAHTLYVSCTPCFSCAKAIANTSIKRVVCLEEYADAQGQRLLMQAGVKIFLASSKPAGVQ